MMPTVRCTKNRTIRSALKTKPGRVSYLAALGLLSLAGCGGDVTTAFQPQDMTTNECVVYANEEFNATMNINGELTIAVER